MDTELYSRQKPLDIFTPDYAMIFGVGGIGALVAVILTMSGVHRLIVWDDDHLELSNLARLPFTYTDVGELKTTVLSKLLLSLRPDLDITCYGKATPELLSMLPDQPNVAFDCTDNGVAQKAIYYWCRSKRIPYIKAGYDGLSISITSKISNWSTTGVEVGYAITPSWVVPAITAAALSVLKCCAYPDLEVHGDLVTITLGESRKGG